MERRARAGLLNALLLSLALGGCSEEPAPTSDAGQPPGPATDDCGQPLVSVPSECDGCHGAPPTTSTHPDNARCARCHGQVVDQRFAFIQPDLHQNGVVDVAVGCSSCHGWDRGVAPPPNLSGECGPDQRGIGAHDAMRNAELVVHRVNCVNCHPVPDGIWAEGHIDGDGRPEVRFSALATAKGAPAVYNRESQTCTEVYCHGATLRGGTLTTPTWTDRSGAAAECGACHGLTDPEGEPDVDCAGCHPQTVGPDGELLARGLHLNGRIDF